MEVPPVIIHLLNLFIPQMPNVSASMVSQCVSYPSGSLLSFHAFAQESVVKLWLLCPGHGHYHPKVWQTSSHYLCQWISLLTLSLSSKARFPLCSFFWTLSIYLQYVLLSKSISATDFYCFFLLPWKENPSRQEMSTCLTRRKVFSWK